MQKYFGLSIQKRSTLGYAIILICSEKKSYALNPTT